MGSTLGACIDWHIEHYDRSTVAWTEAWVAAADARGGKRVLLTEFAALRQIEAALCRRIAAFAGFDPALYRHRLPEKTAAAYSVAASWRNGRKSSTRPRSRTTARRSRRR